MKYRPEIDGLRALAVLPVILFHAGLAAFSGGFVGVDIFFVISGYLITTIILNDLKDNNFSIVRFYERRARRILPALFLVLFASSAVAWVLLSALDGASYAKSVLGVVTFTSNFVFWLDGGYFETVSELKPLLHTWSLAVEEQFYLFFPVLMLLGYRKFRANIVWVLVVIAALSFVMAEWAAFFIADNPQVRSAGFFLPFTRSWELLIGSLVAIRLCRGGVLASLAARNILGLAGLGMIFVAVFAFDSQTPFPSHFALLPTIGTALIILYADSGTVAKWLLSRGALVGVGLVSYSAYLWHQPVFSYYRYYIRTTEISPMALVTLMVLTAVLALLSWKFVEQPFRRKSLITPRIILYSGVSASVAASLFAVVLLVATSDLEKPLAKEISENGFVYFGNVDERTFTLDRLAYDNNNPTALLVGSSRLMLVGSDIVGQPSLNLSVSGASLEDLVAILGAANARYSVEKIYIGVDPWLFNDHSGQTRWTSIERQFDFWQARLRGNTPSVPSVAENERSLFGGVKARIQSLFWATNAYGMMAPSGDPENQLKKAMDGHIVYTAQYSSKTPAEIESGFSMWLNYSMSPYTPSEERRLLFEALIQSFENVEVYLVLSPYHPDLYARMLKEKPVFLEIEDGFRRLAAQQGVRILGAYDPARVGCESAEFFDGMHPKKSCMIKVLSSELGPVPP